ncbi:MAG: arylamine N-acetyltransferase family protein [Gammaproteobacteria bacterium]
MPFDLDAYFERIGYTGGRAPTLATLAAIHARHTEAIPFENLDPLMGWPVRLDPESLQRKMVQNGRGGYCYEHNLLLKQALDALGFRVMGLAARVLWNEQDSPRTHMLLRVDLDGRPYIADAGFGGITLTAPLRLQADIEQTTSHEAFRLVKLNDEFIEQAKLRGEWAPLYRFGLSEYLLSDYQVFNWYVSTHPQSHFVTGLMAARPARDRRYALRGNQLTVHHLDGRTERRVLTSAADMREALAREFLLNVPDAPELDAALERLTARAA